MVKTQSVKHLVLHRSCVQTTVPLQGDGLTTPLAAQVRPTPRSRVEGEVTLMPSLPPDEANAGGLMEGQQGSDDDVTLFCGVRGGDSDRNIDEASTFRPLAACGGAGVGVPL